MSVPRTLVECVSGGGERLAKPIAPEVHEQVVDPSRNLFQGTVTVPDHRTDKPCDRSVVLQPHDPALRQPGEGYPVAVFVVPHRVKEVFARDSRGFGVQPGLGPEVPVHGAGRDSGDVRNRLDGRPVKSVTTELRDGRVEYLRLGCGLPVVLRHGGLSDTRCRRARNPVAMSVRSMRSRSSSTPRHRNHLVFFPDARPARADPASSSARCAESAPAELTD